MPLGTILLVLGVLAATAGAQPKRVLYLTHSAGFRHDSLPVSAEVLRSVAADSGKLEVVHTEDVSLLNAATLRAYDAIFFFTSGELPISAQQKQDLLDFVRSGKGFGGAHSASDTFYTWPEYGEMIGGYFNGHPWVQTVRIDVEDRSHPAVAHLPSAFDFADEIYQFRAISRERVRVLLSLDPRSVDLKAPGVNPNTEDFPLAWVRNYGSGRVFYTALGHPDETWRDPRFQRMLLGAMLWITGQAEGDATPRPQRKPVFLAAANAASMAPLGGISPGSLISIFGQNLAAAEIAAADLREPQLVLGGVSLRLIGVGDVLLPLLYASPGQINAYVPFQAPPLPPCMAIDGCPSRRYYDLEVLSPGGAVTARLDYQTATPGIFIVTGTRAVATVWATGLGPVERRGSLDWTTDTPSVTIGGVAATVQFSGLAPGWLGLYQVNFAVPPGVGFPARLDLRIAGFAASAFFNPAD
jgi:hypothetical protein